jgi:hypothetical protein
MRRLIAAARNKLLAVPSVRQVLRRHLQHQLAIVETSAMHEAAAHMSAVFLQADIERQALRLSAHDGERRAHARAMATINAHRAKLIRRLDHLDALDWHPLEPPRKDLRGKA